jgi:hypothetical protein
MSGIAEEAGQTDAADAARQPPAAAHRRDTGVSFSDRHHASCHRLRFD